MKMKNKGNMLIIIAPCWKCDKNMLVAIVGTEEGDFLFGPEKFSELEKKRAEEQGVCLKLVSSKTADETYLANVCKECGAFVGRWFLFTDFFTPALYGDYKYELLEGTGLN